MTGGIVELHDLGAQVEELAMSIVRRLIGLSLASISSAAFAAIDTFTLDHLSGPCAAAHFSSSHFQWNGRSRISIATDETVRVVMYGHGADLATDATGPNMYEWISAKGRTVDYPGVPMIAGQSVPKGYVVVAMRAEPQHGTGDRTVTVRWSTGSETIPVRVVADCQNLTSAPYRMAMAPGTSIYHPGGAPPTTCKDSNPAAPQCD